MQNYPYKLNLHITLPWAGCTNCDSLTNQYSLKHFGQYIDTVSQDYCFSLVSPIPGCAMVVYWRAPEVRGRWVGVRQLAKHQAITLVADGRQGIANVSLSEID